MDFKKLARAVEKEVIATRRDIHAHPEIALREVRTSRLVEKRLRALGIKTRRMLRTGVVGYLDVKGAKRTVALRADMDALPLEEKARLPYASKNPGVMHACGHDAHTAMLLGVAKVLADHRKGLSGSVRLFFQPAEEAPPGGARFMVEKGCMNGVDEIYAIHCCSETPTGKFVIEPGERMANVDTIRIHFSGKGAHGSMPELSVDPVYTASLAVTALQQVVARNVSAREMAVVSICTLHAGTIHNVIPDSAVMSGTVRTFSKELRRRMPAMIRRVIAGVCKSSGATFELRYEKGHDVLINDAGATEVARVGAIELFGRKCLHDNPPRLAGEDFSEYLKQAPGCLIRLGTADRKRGTCIAHHSPLYRLDERGLWRGVALLSKLAWERAGSAG